MKRTFDVLTSSLSSFARMGAGLLATRGAIKPEILLELYEFEVSPYCRKVREALTELDLDVRIHPCPKGGTVHRPQAIELGGKAQFPLLLDPNTGHVLYESADIIHYLFARYGNGRPPAWLRIDALATATSFLASGMRPFRGMNARPSRQPEAPLELYGFEASPYCRLVRETLCELELSYIQRNLGRGGPIDHLPPALRSQLAPNATYTTAKRRDLAERVGHVQLPYLVDRNTGTELFESAEINTYLEETYAL